MRKSEGGVHQIGRDSGTGQKRKAEAVRVARRRGQAGGTGPDYNVSYNGFVVCKQLKTGGRKNRKFQDFLRRAEGRFLGGRNLICFF